VVIEITLELADGVFAPLHEAEQLRLLESAELGLHCFSGGRCTGAASVNLTVTAARELPARIAQGRRYRPEG
jgi:hypothetical protein